jgi:hypothetical protein
MHVLVLWLRNLLSEIGLGVLPQAVVHCDNTATIIIADNGIVSDKTKHIDIKYKYIKECVDNDVVSVQHVSTTEQQADILTKALSGQQFGYLRNKLMAM